MLSIKPVSASEFDELDKQKVVMQLMTKLAEAKVAARKEGTISADDLEKELEIDFAAKYEIDTDFRF